MLRFFTSILILFSLTAQAQLNLNLMGQFSYPTNISDVWGYEDAAGNEYAFVGTQVGLSVVSLINPTTPVEIDFINGPNTTWRDIKTYSHYAYVVNEAFGGLLIIDLSNLPTSISYTQTLCEIGFQEAHNIFIDVPAGRAYLFGAKADSLTNGNYILDLTADPENPVYLGQYDTYIHDGFARGDTLWGSQIYEGTFAAVDVSDPANPVVLGSHITPLDFTHACWLSPDGKTLAASDETAGAFVSTFDVSDLNNIVELDRFQTPTATNAIMHNTFYHGNYIFNSYYTAGVVVLDATYPDNLVQVAYYDTSPVSGGGFVGCWGVYPYFSSGNVLATDRQQGLFYLSFTPQNAGYLQGDITDANTGFPIADAQIQIQHPEHYGDASGLTGQYKTGIVGSVTTNVTVTANGYYSQTVQATISEGFITYQDFDLVPIVPCDNSYAIQLKAFLEGMYNQTLDEMTADINQLGLIPLNQPFNTAPFNYTGVEFLHSVDPTIIDWVFVELRDVTDPSIIIDQRACLIHQDGMLSDIDGRFPLKFCDATAGGTYYVTLYHKSHLGVISSSTITLSNSSNYDFSSSTTQAAGFLQQKMLNTKAVLYSGEYDNNGLLNNQDFNKWAQQNAIVNQYINWDCDGNGVVNNLDFNLWEVNKSKVGNSLIAKP